MSPRSKRWWTKEVKEMRKEMARRLRRWKILLSPETFSDFKLAQNKYFRKIREGKENTWNSFLNDAQGAEVFRALQYYKPRKYQHTPVLKYENRTATTFTEKSSIL